MRRVKVTFQDGTVQQWDTILDAARALQIDKQTVSRMVIGLSPVARRLLHIRSIEIEPNRHPAILGERKRGRGCHMICTSQQTGRQVEVFSIREAQKTLPFPHVLNYAINDGEYHFGWRFDLVDDNASPYAYDEPVPDEIIELLYRYSKHIMRMYTDIPQDEWDDIRQHAVDRVSADWSRGVYKTKDCTMHRWMYRQLQHYCVDGLRKYFRYRDHYANPSDPDADKDEFIDATYGGRTDREAEERMMYEEMPEHLREIARMIQDGRKRDEINHRLKLADRQRNALVEELTEWLQRRQRGETE